MQDDIIDNRESYLADAVRPLLNQSVRGHFAVGYFFLSGFKAIAKELKKVAELRLLIGNTSDRPGRFARQPGTERRCSRQRQSRAVARLIQETLARTRAIRRRVDDGVEVVVGAR
jgi:hypothetical protein